MNLAKLARFHSPAERLEPRDIAPPVGNLERDAVPFDGLFDLPDLYAREPTRLLAQDGQARLGNLDHERRVEVARGGDEDAVHALRVEELSEVREGREPPFGDRGPRRLHRLDDGRHRDAGRASECAQVGATHPSRTDQPEPEHGSAHRPRAARKARLPRWSTAARSKRSFVWGSVSCSTTSQPR